LTSTIISESEIRPPFGIDIAPRAAVKNAFVKILSSLMIKLSSPSTPAVTMWLAYQSSHPSCFYWMI
jgi:hypothetical protein